MGRELEETVETTTPTEGRPKITEANPTTPNARKLKNGEKTMVSRLIQTQKKKQTRVVGG